jgi:hypothetical protein
MVSTPTRPKASQPRAGKPTSSTASRLAASGTPGARAPPPPPLRAGFRAGWGARGGTGATRHRAPD